VLLVSLYNNKFGRARCAFEFTVLGETNMKHFILVIALMVISFEIAAAQQTRKLDKDANTESSGLRKATQEDYGTHDTRISVIQVGDLYADGNREDHLKYVQMIMDYAAEYDYYILEVHVNDIAYLKGENYDGYKNTLRIEEAVLPGDAKMVSVFAQLKTIEVAHYFSNKPFSEPHVKKVNEAVAAGPMVRTLKAKETDTAVAQQKDAWNKYFDNVYKGAIGKLKTAQTIAGRKKSPLLDNINRDIKLLESHNKEHLLFYSKQ
jgi:hypothetical protein